jgi:hypothetical protein
VMHSASIAWCLIAFNCAWGVQNRKGPELLVEEQEHQHGAYNAHNIWAAIEAVNVQAVHDLLAEEPERATTARPTDGFTPLHAAAARLAPDVATDRDLAIIMAILLQPQYKVDVHALNYNGDDARAVMDEHANGVQAARRFVLPNLAALN